jgi:hypothetical protein
VTGDLVDGRLARADRHDREGVVAIENGLDGGQLAGAKPVEPK